MQCRVTWCTICCGQQQGKVVVDCVTDDLVWSVVQLLLLLLLVWWWIFFSFCGFKLFKTPIDKDLTERKMQNKSLGTYLVNGSFNNLRVIRSMRWSVGWWWWEEAVFVVMVFFWLWPSTKAKQPSKRTIVFDDDVELHISNWVRRSWAKWNVTIIRRLRNFPKMATWKHDSSWLEVSRKKLLLRSFGVMRWCDATKHTIVVFYNDCASSCKLPLHSSEGSSSASSASCWWATVDAAAAHDSQV